MRKARSLPPVFYAVTSLAVLNGARGIIDAGEVAPTDEAERMLYSRVAASSPSDVAAKVAVAGEGGWGGCVVALYARMRAKAIACNSTGRAVPKSVEHSLINAALAARKCGAKLPSDESLADKVKWIIDNNGL